MFTYNINGEKAKLRGIHLSDEIHELYQQKTILDKRVDMLTQILIMNSILKKILVIK